MQVTYSAITPNDNASLPFPSRALYLGAGGDVTCQGIGANDTTVVFKALPQGWNSLPWPFGAIKATGTTATNLIAAGF